MVSKSALIVVVGAVSALSVGAGTYLAYRANQTPAPVVEASSPSASPATRLPESPAPSPVPANAAPVSRPAAPSRQVRAQAAATESAREQSGQAAPPVTGDPSVPPPAAAATPSVTPPADPPTTTNAAVAAADPPPAQEPPKPRFEEITIKPDAVIGIRLDTAISSETAKLEDRVTAKITRDVTVDGRTALAAGTRLEGVVVEVEKGNKFRERARIGIRFNTLILSDNLRVPIQTEKILREGDSPASEAGSKIGASAVAGAILGGIIGGKRGAVIGSTVGAGGGTAAVMAGGRNEAAIASGAPLTVRLLAPVTITIERDAGER